MKFIWFAVPDNRSRSLPVRGAWIEIWENVTGELNEAVAPRKGSVD